MSVDSPTPSAGRSKPARTCHAQGICLHPTQQCSGACQQGEPNVHDYSLQGSNSPFDFAYAAWIGAFVFGIGGLAGLGWLAVSAWTRWFA